MDSRRAAALLVGLWLGAGILTDIAVSQNFQTVDRFLAAPGNPDTAAEIGRAGHDVERAILRRNAGEENNWIFLNWERAELVLGAAVLATLAFGGAPRKMPLALALGMTAIVAAEHFFLTGAITDLGRQVDRLPATDPEAGRFWMLHGFYSGLDLLKLAMALVLAIRLVMKPESQKSTEPAPGSAKTEPTGLAGESARRG